ncbi:MAG TPA: alpha-1,2-fucosyltransferase [Chitinophagaceae bacterium]|nr:alpha-1,2-fucosyltransferase [Chitinophagaceae bacterium]
MIISHINGGLGNQMFQFAAGKALAVSNNTILKLDVSEYDKNKLRSFDLLAFETEISFATRQEINELLPPNKWEKTFQYLSPLKKRSYYRERSFSFDGKVPKLGKNVYLKGYFQSEKYFAEAKDIVRKEFTLKEQLINHLAEFSSSLKNLNSVSIHVRRGDFSTSPETTAYHGTLDADYYNAALGLVRSRLTDPAFYIFSDDIEWTKNNFQVSNAIFVSGQITKNHFEDLYLMTQCKHNIIANSSYSWWGAWLNNNPGKVVIAPKKWFSKGPKDTRDLIPRQWLRI